MGKATFSDEALAIWQGIYGMKELGLANPNTHNLVDILQDELGLKPVLVQVGDEVGPYSYAPFKALLPRQVPDGRLSAFYHPADCEAATGSNAANWTQWSARLHGYGHGSHPLAPKMRVLDADADRLRASGAMGRNQVTRLLSVEMVVFYIAVQTRTWGNPNRMLAVKDRIQKQDVNTIGYVLSPTDEEVDVDHLLGADDDAPAPAPAPDVRTRAHLPKAAADVVAYNPTTSRPPPVDTADDVDALLEAVADTPALESDLTDADLVREAERLKEEAARLEALIQTRKEDRWKKRFEEEAREGKVVGGTAWPTRGEWALLKMSFPNGREIVYFHRELLVAYLTGKIDPSMADPTIAAAITRAREDLDKAGVSSGT
jgi:hypothetical protein